MFPQTGPFNPLTPRPPPQVGLPHQAPTPLPALPPLPPLGGGAPNITPPTLPQLNGPGSGNQGLQQMLQQGIGYSLGQGLMNQMPAPPLPGLPKGTTMGGLYAGAMGMPTSNTQQMSVDTGGGGTTAIDPTSLGGTSGAGSDTTSSYKTVAEQYAQQYGVPASIFDAQINQESGWNPNARSSAGAMGIAQIMPGTAQGWGVDPTNPVASLQAAAKAMGDYYKRYNSWPAALIAYNGGEGTLQAYLKGGPLPDETRAYVKDIMGIDLP